MRSVICRVHDDGILGNTQLIELVQHHSDFLIMGNHGIVIKPLTAFTLMLFGNVGSKMHGRCVVPDEERFVRLVRIVDKT